MLKTIGRAGAGEKKRGGGNPQMAVAGVRLLIESIERSTGDSEIAKLIESIQGNLSGVEDKDAEEYADPEEDADLEALTDEIDEYQAS